MKTQCDNVLQAAEFDLCCCARIFCFTCKDLKVSLAIYVAVFAVIFPRYLS